MHVQRASLAATAINATGVIEMPYLSEQTLQQMNAGPYSRNGQTVPGSNMLPVACWAWALAGQAVAASDEFSAPSLYERSFTWDVQRRPTGTNADYLNQVTAIWPDTELAVSALIGYAGDAIAGDRASQLECRMALMKIAAICNGLSVVGDGANHDYVLVLKSSSWCGWDHWALAIRMPPGSHPVNYVQTVPDISLRYACDTTWDEGLPSTTIGLDGLLATHIAVLDGV